MAVLFFSYSHKDEGLRDQLETHLRMLQRQGFIEAWHDRRILAGTPLDSSIDAQMERADIVLLLVSSDFLASEYCYEREMQRALVRHREGACVVIPVILRPCDWRDAPFAPLMALPTDGKPVTKWPNADEAFLEITTGIKKLVKTRNGRVPKPAVPSVAAMPSTGATAAAPTRSSNLRITRRFSDRDCDNFRHEAFEFLFKFFGNSIAELKARHEDIDGETRRVDANAFTALLYRDGAAVAECTIFMGQEHFAGGIAYANKIANSRSAFNESLSVQSDEQALFLKPLGMSMSGTRGDDDKLSMQGAGEYYWSIFIEPLQRGIR
ncbi:toll/interleukin-1 receptor domain-containing protein [Bradyrhizobium sp. Pear77]|uniref:toll/interleukin-1 receptor domain-containing protein n=1 Tax=Bradyrhizobium altum TaxID=1571202 RepID=UPI001E5C1454|nr:toll/interleukin-1 receptor domain-containing protein [Bradyrhizobium altum]MCC8955042.1 toll/interleukin-1 receptor domain-containing protein [Bradyrhizobium altum]